MLPSTLIDSFIVQADKTLRTLSSAHQAQRPMPSAQSPQAEILNDAERRHSAALMRINHCGEICAQALYQGQGLTAKNSATRISMQHAAEEEIDHLVWCEQRLAELGSRTSYLNPLWHALSFSLGAAMGTLGDKVSLGFIAATEQQVCLHLEKHLVSLPENDEKSRHVLRQMLSDERQHGEQALTQGGTDFPAPIKTLMSHISKVMTKASYYI